MRRKRRILRSEIKKNAGKSEIGCEGIIRLELNSTREKKGTYCTGTKALKARHNQGTI